MSSKIALPALSPAWQRANSKASRYAARGIHAERVSPRVWRVASGSRPDQSHLVTINSIIALDVSCDCEAGSRGLVCVHQSLAVSGAIKRIHELRLAQQTPAIEVVSQTVVSEPPAPAAPTRKTSEEVEARLHKMFAKPAALRDR